MYKTTSNVTFWNTLYLRSNLSSLQLNALFYLAVGQTHRLSCKGSYKPKHSLVNLVKLNIRNVAKRTQY